MHERNIQVLRSCAARQGMGDRSKLALHIASSALLDIRCDRRHCVRCSTQNQNIDRIPPTDLENA